MVDGAVSGEWRGVFEQLVQTGGTVEVTGLSESIADELAPVYRCRLLAFDDDGLVIERPTAPLAGRYFRRDGHLTILAANTAQRWQCLASVIRRVKFPLNDRVRVDALELTAPKDVQSAQRRAYFRVSVTERDLQPALLMPIDEDGAGGQGAAADDDRADPREPAANPRRSRAFKAELRSLGGGGLGVTASRDVLADVEYMNRYRCRFSLPTDEAPVEIGVQLVHIQPHSEDLVYLALRFEAEDAQRQQQFANKICRFTAWQQRRQLRRRQR